MNKIVLSQENDPYFNLALEEELLRNACHDEVALYLWQNDKTVVIGRNQNPYTECDIEQLKSNEVSLARRISGGGAVYHDLGNLNFTFIFKKEQENLEKQLEVIKGAVESFGLEVALSGRNDITYQGKKFSGHAFYAEEENGFHHGTLMVEVNLEQLERILKPSKLKLEAKGISSVKSRVINLKELNNDISVASLTEALIKSFKNVYGNVAAPVRYSKMTYTPLLMEKYFDNKWIYRESPKYNVIVERSTPSGNIQAFFNVEHGVVKFLKIYSDSLAILNFEEFENKFINIDFHQIMEKNLLEEIFRDLYENSFI
ncbi:lipoate--protein ligase [Paenibacillus sp. FSL P4-0184]|uniref:lipoate--protein ligase n=1 Tax=Paenibacillus sp. FSL P4-0184 TaxID=2921632 RepID=UPI0030F563AB